MAINAYTGLQGSGKSYEAVLMVVVPAIRVGRRVVTNINGISESEIYYYLEKRGGDASRFGTVVHVSNDDVTRPGFFPAEAKPDEPSVVRRGDLVVIDEAWRFWGTDEKMPKEHMEFFRMHRQYVDPVTGVTCDVALILQSISDLHRTLKAVVELHSRTTKLKTVGTPTRYRVELFEGARVTKAAKFDTLLRKYEPDVFPLYKSYQGIAGNETAIDSRQNIFKNPRVWAMGVLSLLMFVGSIWTLYYIYGRLTHKKATEPAERPVATNTAPLQGAVSGAQSAPAATSLRIAGIAMVRGQPFVALVDQSGRIRLEAAGNFTGYGSLLSGVVDGRLVTTWSGPAAQGQNAAVLPFAVPGAAK
ncbi:MAG: Zonular occludens toxin [Thiobacillus sp.]|nr:Zonular occludens toxin [Thiobacillus sp.]